MDAKLGFPALLGSEGVGNPSKMATTDTVDIMYSELTVEVIKT